MKKTTIGLMMLIASLILPSVSNAQGSSNQQTTDEIIAIVKAQWAAENANPGNTAEIYKNVADDYTEFNGAYATRLEGKTLAMRLSEATAKDPNQTVAAEMLNTRVQVYGDVAILTYNFAGVTKNKDNETKPVRAKSTRIYVKMGGKWKLVHANFAPDPLPKD